MRPLSSTRRYLLGSAVLMVVSLSGCEDAASGKGAVIFHSSERNRTLDFPFSTAVEADGWVFLSGALGISPDTGELVAGGVEAEARQTMENIKSNLEGLGLSMGDIVKCTVMIDDMADWPAFNQIYKTYFDDDYPARSAFGADGLALGAVVEVECIAKR